MNEQDIKALLSVAMAYDNRRPGAANVAAWTEAATRAGWRFDDALDAVHAHYAESTDFLMPGHITARLRLRSRQPAKYVALPPATPAEEASRSRVMTMIRGRFRLPDSMRREAKPERNSAEHAAAREAARAELEALRSRQEAQS